VRVVEADGETSRGDERVLRVEAEGLPAVTEDGAIFATFRSVDYWGHTTETSLDLIDVESLRVDRAVLARAAERIVSTDGESFPRSLRAKLDARVRAGNARLAKHRWTVRASVPSTAADPVADAAPYLAAPRWTSSRVPRCGYGSDRRVPAERIDVVLVSTSLVVLRRDWDVGTHACDGVVADPSFAFVRPP
jgi:hypothetical protein